MGMVRGLGCEHEINLAKFRSNLVLFRCVEEYLDLRTYVPFPWANFFSELIFKLIKKKYKYVKRQISMQRKFAKDFSKNFRKIFLVMMFCYYLFICLLLFFEIQCENINFANNVVYAINCGSFLFFLLFLYFFQIIFPFQWILKKVWKRYFCFYLIDLYY